MDSFEWVFFSINHSLNKLLKKFNWCFINLKNFLLQKYTHSKQSTHFITNFHNKICKNTHSKESTHIKIIIGWRVGSLGGVGGGLRVLRFGREFCHRGDRSHVEGSAKAGRQLRWCALDLQGRGNLP